MNVLKIGFLGLWIVFVGFGLALTTTATDAETPDVSAAPPPEAVTVVGKVEVVPASGDQAATVRIVDSKEGLLVVDTAGPGGGLADLEGELVSATGTVVNREDGTRVISVSSFRSLGGS